MNLFFKACKTQANNIASPVAILALMMFLVPALGVPSDLMVQDTLKSALVAFGVLIAALVFFWQQRERTAPLLWHGLMWLPLALMAYALGSMAWSHTYLAGVEAIRWFLLSLLLWLGLNTFTRANLTLLVWGIHSGAFIASVWAALQFWFDFSLFPQAATPASTFANCNFFAEYAVCALPFSVYLLANLRASRWLALMALSVAFNVVALTMTGTRSALTALLVLVPVFLLILIRHRQQFAFIHWSKLSQLLVIGVLTVGVAGLSAIPSMLPNNTGSSALQRSLLRAATITQPQEYAEGSMSVRIVRWKATARMLLTNPWSGIGAGAWEVQIPLYQQFGESVEVQEYVHNELLQLLVEYGGPVGGLFLAVLFAYLLLAAGKTWRLQDADRQEAPLRALTLTSLLALLLVSNAGFPWHLAGTCAMFALCLGILAASDARLGIREAFFAAPLRWRPGFSRAALAGLLCCTLLAAYITQQAAEAEWKIVRAIQHGNALAQPGTYNAKQLAERKAQLLQYIREGIAINPHYPKLSLFVADRLAASGDWANAVGILESAAASRPHVADLWAKIVLAHTKLDHSSQAQGALKQLQRLQPDTPRTRVLEIMLLSSDGHQAQAVQVLTDYFDQGRHEQELIRIAYALGLKLHNWPLAIRALELYIENWPAQAADSYLRLGKIYADPELHDDAKALSAFRAGLATSESSQQADYRKKTPEKYRARL